MSIDLNDKAVKDAIAAAVAEAVEEATSGLKTKNQELLGKLKKAQQGSTIDPADFEALERERDQLKVDLTAANKAATKATNDLKAANERAEQAEGFTSKLLIDNGLNEALVKNGVVNPVHQKAAKAMLAGQVQIVDDAGNKVPKVGDKALADFVKTWADGDEGKHFVTAPSGNGGGAGNGNPPRNPNAPTLSRQAFDGLSPVERAQHIQKQGVVTE